MGVSVVNALSKRMMVEVKKDGQIYYDEYKDGGKPARMSITYEKK